MTEYKIYCGGEFVASAYTHEIKNKYKWPSSYFGGEGIKKSCHIILMIQSGTKIVIDPTTKKKVKISTSKVKMEISHPQFSKVEDFESSVSTLEYNLYSKFLDWGVFSDLKSSPLISTDNKRPAAVPTSR